MVLPLPWDGAFLWMILLIFMSNLWKFQLVMNLFSHYFLTGSTTTLWALGLLPFSLHWLKAVTFMVQIMLTLTCCHVIFLTITTITFPIQGLQTTSLLDFYLEMEPFLPPASIIIFLFMPSACFTQMQNPLIPFLSLGQEIFSSSFNCLSQQS